MTWTRLSDNFNDRHDLLMLSRSARLLHVEGLVYGNRLGSDGEIPTGALQRFTDAADVESDLSELVRAELWVELPGGRGWQITGWKERELQEPAADVEHRQQAVRDKQSRYRRRVASCGQGDHSDCNTRCSGKRKHDAGDHSGCWDKCADRNDDRNADGDITTDVTQSRSSRPPDPEGQGERERCDHGFPIIREADGTTTRCAKCVERERKKAA